MLKVLKYLKKTKFSVIAIIILLCIQAMADLALPDYTSKIVNIGIQQSGIKEVSPKVIRKSKMDEILLLTNDDNEILENYELISKDNLSNKDYEKYLKEYTNNYEKIDDREDAIKKAVNYAISLDRNSILLILGKGNDNTQKVMNGYAKYKSDIEQVKDYFDEYDKSISNI